MQSNYKKLQVWQRSLKLCLSIYDLTDGFPQSEQFNLVSQMRRSATSVPSNIAEGAGRKSKQDFVRFLRIAEGSCNELETQLLISKHRAYISLQQAEDSEKEINEILRMLGAFAQKVQSSD